MSDNKAGSALTTLDTPSISQGSTPDNSQSSPTISSSSSSSEVGNIDEIMQRIHREKVNPLQARDIGERQIELMIRSHILGSTNQVNWVERHGELSCLPTSGPWLGEGVGEREEV